MDKQKHIDESILLGYFTGTISIPLQQEVEDWLAASEENKKIARDIQYICQATDTLTCIRETDSYAALKKVKNRIHSHWKVSLSTWLQRIAAILIFPLIISTIYFTFKKDPIEYIEIRTNPGMVATVKLPDGTKVWLNSRSYLKHPTRFTGNTRDVVLNGEAYFSVHKDKSKRFTVSTPLISKRKYSVRNSIWKPTLQTAA